jgi:hypothetical protein
VKTTTALAVTATAVALAGCGTTVKSTTDTPPAAASTIPGITPAAASPSPAAPLTGPAGTAFTVPAALHADGSYTVTLDQVTQRATLAADQAVVTPGDHVAAAGFTITGKTGQVSEDADNYATAIGSDGQYYTPATETITEGTNFSGGVFSVAPGQSVRGWVAFEIPAGVKVASVQWQTGDRTATWRL